MICVLDDEKISLEELKHLCHTGFQDMVKIVVDIENRRIGIGGELHSDAESLLIERGSKQEDIWGVNFYPWHASEQRIDYTALINIRPHQNNPSMEILDQGVREKVKQIVETRVLGPDEKLV